MQLRSPEVTRVNFHLTVILIFLSIELLICAECSCCLRESHVVFDIDTLLCATLTPKIPTVPLNVFHKLSCRSITNEAVNF